MNGFWLGLAFGALVALGTVALARFLRQAADERLREKRYADEWVARHRGQS